MVVLHHLNKSRSKRIIWLLEGKTYLVGERYGKTLATHEAFQAAEQKEIALDK